MSDDSKIAAAQTAKLDALIAALQTARKQAERGLFFASADGLAATYAAFDLFETDGLYDLCGDVAHEIGVDVERRAA